MLMFLPLLDVVLYQLSCSLQGLEDANSDKTLGCHRNWMESFQSDFEIKLIPSSWPMP